MSNVNVFQYLWRAREYRRIFTTSKNHSACQAGKGRDSRLWTDGTWVAQTDRRVKLFRGSLTTKVYNILVLVWTSCTKFRFDGQSFWRLIFLFYAFLERQPSSQMFVSASIFFDGEAEIIFSGKNLAMPSKPYVLKHNSHKCHRTKSQNLNWVKNIK